jgi:hypothetical protein
MEQKHLAELMIDYLSWHSRYVGWRPRQIVTEPPAFGNPLWTKCSRGIQVLLEKVRNGQDLTPHLSLSPHTEGYTPASRAKGASNEERWSDKDFLLNIMGFHHFHLGERLEQKGHAARTDELLFAEVTRDAFKIIDLFTHEVFEPASAERMRLWATHEQITLRGLAPGAVVLMGDIATSGHPTHLVLYAGHCARIVSQLDPKLDDPAWVQETYKNAGLPSPKKLKLRWAFNHLDIGLVDPVANVFFIMHKGWN